VRIQDVTEDFAEGLGMGEAIGALIAGLSDDGPAAKAGIKPGDVVVEFDGKKVESMRALPRLVADTPPGDTVDVKVLRDGKEVMLKLEVGLLAEEKVAAADPKDTGGEGKEDATGGAAGMFGLTLGAITDAARKEYSIDATVEGVLVTEVEAGSEAEEKSVKPGDVIVQVGQKPVTGPEDVAARIEQLKSEGRKTVMLLVSGAENKLRFVSLRLEDAQ
jgi:serine protease Do